MGLCFCLALYGFHIGDDELIFSYFFLLICEDLLKKRWILMFNDI